MSSMCSCVSVAMLQFSYIVQRDVAQDQSQQSIYATNSYCLCSQRLVGYGMALHYF